MGLSLVYLVATVGLGVDTQGAHLVFLASLAITGVALVVRYVRLKRAGAHLAYWEPPAMTAQDRPVYLVWLCAAAALGLFSTFAIGRGELLVGVSGATGSVSSMFVLARGLARPPAT